MATEEAEPRPPEEQYPLEEVVERSGLPARTIRWYQSEGLLPKPAKHGRDAVYGPEHVERLRLIADLRDRGLTLVAIRDLLKDERPASTVAEWLGIDATLTAPWSDDRPRVVDRDELTAMTRGRRPGLLAELQDTGYVQAADAGTWLVPSPGLLDLALQLHDAGIDLELSAQLRDLLRRRLAKVVDDAVKLLVERTGTGFAGNATAAELATAVGALRPIARETTSLILAQEVERALRQLVDRGPAAIVRARRH